MRKARILKYITILLLGSLATSSYSQDKDSNESFKTENNSTYASDTFSETENKDVNTNNTAIKTFVDAEATDVKYVYQSAHSSTTNIHSWTLVQGKSVFFNAILREDGSALVWIPSTDSTKQDQIVHEETEGVDSIYSNKSAILLLKKDGAILTFGDPKYGGNLPEDKKTQINAAGGVKNIVYNTSAFAVVTKTNTLVTWGEMEIPEDQNNQIKEGNGVKMIVANDQAFAVATNNDTLVMWGDDSFTDIDINDQIKTDGGIKNILTVNQGFLLITNKDNVFSWGGFWSDSEKLSYGRRNLIHDTGIKTVATSRASFAVVTKDDTVVTWGNVCTGGKIPLYKQEQIKKGGVKAIASAWGAFAVVTNDDTIVTWENGANKWSVLGGPDDIYEISEDKQKQIKDGNGVKTIISNMCSFIVITNNGTFVTWGDKTNGGNPSEDKQKQIEAGNGIKTFAMTDAAVAVVTNNNTVVTWGLANFGGDSSAVQDQLTDVDTVVAIGPYNFKAIKKDGTSVIWGKLKLYNNK